MFADRADAGRQLGLRLEYLRGGDAVVLGVPRGGVPVAFEVAGALGAPLDVILVRKLGVPFQPELAMGAIGEEGASVLDKRVLSLTRVKQEDLRAVEERERSLLNDRVARFRSGRTLMDLSGRTAVIVDDGIATGSTARVACSIARKLGAARVILAVPVAPADVLRTFTEADEVVCLATPRQLTAVSQHYRDFAPTTDDEVVWLLDASAERVQRASSASRSPVLDQDVQIHSDGVRLQGHLTLPRPDAAVVVFAHGSGSGRHSPRNRFVASTLQQAGLGTLLLDLLSWTAPTCSTSNCLRGGSPQPQAGLAASRTRPPAAWDISARVQEREPRCGRLPNKGRRSAQWSRGEAGRTWQVPGLPGSAPRRS